MARAVMMGTMSLSAVSVSFSVGVFGKGGHNQKSDREAHEERKAFLAHSMNPILIRGALPRSSRYFAAPSRAASGTVPFLGIGAVTAAIHKWLIQSIEASRTVASSGILGNVSQATDHSPELLEDCP